MNRSGIRAKAMVFAAGLGTRLRPYTNDRPKALVEVGGMSLLEIQLRRLMRFGVEEVVVNAHHFAELVETELDSLRHLGMEIKVSDERGMLLETGGGLKKAGELLGRDKPILIANVDVLTDLNLRDMESRLEESGALAVMAVRQRETSRYLVWGKDLRLKGWMNKKTGETRGNVEAEDLQLAFSGVHMIRPEFLDLIRQEGKFSIIDTYLDLAQSQLILGHRHDEDLWMDVGKPDQLEEANRSQIEKKLLF